jgi:hypothetical protein
VDGRQDMGTAGFTRLAANMGFRELLDQQMLVRARQTGRGVFHSLPSDAYSCGIALRKSGYVGAKTDRPIGKEAQILSPRWPLDDRNRANG